MKKHSLVTLLDCEDREVDGFITSRHKVFYSSEIGRLWQGHCVDYFFGSRTTCSALLKVSFLLPTDVPCHTKNILNAEFMRVHQKT